jgi:hypothetical protein
MALAVPSLPADPATQAPGRKGNADARGTAREDARSGSRTTPASGDALELLPEAKALVAKLQARDADVHAHEEAHLAAGGSLVTSAASYTYERGPDGRSYAVGGEVGIDTSPVEGNPQATVAKALHIEAAARAPADPSAQDQAVAAQAAAMAAQASAEMARSEPGTGGTKESAGAQAYKKAAAGGEAPTAAGSRVDARA